MNAQFRGKGMQIPDTYKKCSVSLIIREIYIKLNWERLFTDRSTSIPAMEPTRDCEPVLAPLSPGLGVPAEHWLGLSPTDKRAFVEVHVSRVEVTALQWVKKYIYESRCIGEGKRNNMNCQNYLSPKVAQLKVKLYGLWFLWQGKGKAGE